MPLEKTITNAIMKTAKSEGWWVMKVHGGAYQMSGIPDILAIKAGRAVFLEVKQPGKAPTPLQEQRMHEIRTVGGAVAETVTSKHEAMEVLSRWDQ